MTTQQANLIREMCENPFDIKRFDKAHAELLQSCSDTEPCLVPTPQPTVSGSRPDTARPWPPRAASFAPKTARRRSALDGAACAPRWC